MKTLPKTPVPGRSLAFPAAEWSARNPEEYGTYDLAARYLVRFAPFPAFRHLTPHEYQDRVATAVAADADDHRFGIGRRGARRDPGDGDPGEGVVGSDGSGGDLAFRGSEKLVTPNL
ncbi:MAG: hypothetical protein GY722_27590 [bacterium]|nr:hypothetical protein [bacterium]